MGWWSTLAALGRKWVSPHGSGPLAPRGPGSPTHAPVDVAVPADLQRWAGMVVERVRILHRHGAVQFPKWLFNPTNETPEIVAAYREMLAEPTIKAAVQTNVLAVASLDLSTHPQDRSSKRERDIAKALRYALDRVEGGPPAIAWSILFPAQIDGWSVNEPVWEQEWRGQYRGKYVWRALKDKDTKRIDPVTDAYGNVLGLRAYTEPGVVYDARDFVVYRNQPMFGNPRGISDLRAAYRAWWIKSVAWRLRGVALEKWSAGPMLKGTYTSTEQQAALEQALEDAKANTWITAPDGVLIEAINLAVQGTSDFQSAIQDCDREMLIAINGSYLQVLEGKTTGARAMGEVHQTTSELKPWLLGATLSRVVTEQMGQPFTEINYGNDIPPPVVTWGAINEEAVAASIAVDSGLQAMGLMLSKKDTYQKYGRSEPEDETDVLTPIKSTSAAPSSTIPQQPAQLAPVA